MDHHKEQGTPPTEIGTCPNRDCSREWPKPLRASKGSLLARRHTWPSGATLTRLWSKDPREVATSSSSLLGTGPLNLGPTFAGVSASPKPFLAVDPSEGNNVFSLRFRSGGPPPPRLYTYDTTSLGEMQPQLREVFHIGELFGFARVGSERRTCGTGLTSPANHPR